MNTHCTQLIIHTLTNRDFLSEKPGADYGSANTRHLYSVTALCIGGAVSHGYHRPIKQHVQVSGVYTAHTHISP